jgi:GGDEF domain-containing protein
MTGIAKRLVDALSSPIETAGAGQVVVGASVGVTCSLQTDQDIQRILLRADKALYEVKLAGRGAWKIAPRQTSVHQSGNAIFFGPEAMSLKFIPS